MRHPLSWRSRWPRAIILLALLTLALRLSWGWHAARKLDRQVAQLRARGEPVWAADLNLPRVPNEENAFHVQLQAAGATVPGVDSPRSSNLTYRDYPPYPGPWMSLAASSETAHGQVFRLARRARQLTGVQIRGDQLPSPIIQASITHLNSLRHFANILADGSTYMHVHGNDAEAVDRALDLLHLPRSLRHDPILISHLIAIGIDALACASIQSMAPGLRASEGSIERQKVRELIARLLDERDLWDGLRRGIEAERVVHADAIRWRGDGAWLLKPAVDLQIVRTNDHFDIALAAARQRNKPATLAALAPWEREMENARPLFLTAPPTAAASPTVPRFSRWFRPEPMTMTRFFETFYRTLAERRATAVSLAARLYYLDHGRWPDRLDELVPKYLPALPADPFHDDGRPFGYTIARGALPDGGDRPLIYFDAGPADPAGWVDEPTYGWYIRRGARGPWRQYRDLSRWSPPPGAQPTWSPAALGSATRPAATRPDN